jgi:squalene-hopene/tetraprenyl-beta-curcumene cyclase
MRRHTGVILAALLGGALMLTSCGGENEGPVKKPAAKAKANVDLLKKMAAATDKACAFLAKSQNEDGGWGGRGTNVGITGLVIESMAQMPAELRKKHAETIDKGVALILKSQREDGAIVGKDGQVANYCTTISARALIALDPEKYKKVIAGAVKYTKGIQRKDGSIGYGGNPDLGDIMNLSQALEMLAEAGVKKDDEVWKRAIAFLARTQNLDEVEDDLVKVMIRTANDGGAIYRADRDAKDASKAGTIKLPDGTEVPRSYGGATYALLKSLLFAGMPKDNPRVKAAYKWICDHYTVKEHPEMKKQGLFYFYYTMARTLELWGSPTITSKGVEHNWAEELAAELLSLQQDDGSWVNKQDRWWEADPTLVSAYGINVLNMCRGLMAK